MEFKVIFGIYILGCLKKESSWLLRNYIYIANYRIKLCLLNFIKLCLFSSTFQIPYRKFETALESIALLPWNSYNLLANDRRDVWKIYFSRKTWKGCRINRPSFTRLTKFYVVSPEKPVRSCLRAWLIEAPTCFPAISCGWSCVRISFTALRMKFIANHRACR